MLPVDPSPRLPSALLLSKGTIQLLPGQQESFLHPIAAGLQGAAQDRGSRRAGGGGCEQLLRLLPPAPGSRWHPVLQGEAGRSRQRSEGKGPDIGGVHQRKTFDLLRTTLPSMNESSTCTLQLTLTGTPAPGR